MSGRLLFLSLGLKGEESPDFAKTSIFRGLMVVGNAHRAVTVKVVRSRESATETILILDFYDRKKGEKELGVSQGATGFALR